MSRMLRLTPDCLVLDLGSGYGGAARYLASTFGCRVTCLNLSEVENQRNRELTRKRGLEHLVEVREGSFEELPFEDNAFDVIWSQDAFLHRDRKSTRLNSSHVKISYAVFCLKK